MSKNIGSFLALNDLWFDKNQRLLLWLLNAPIIKVWFRFTLRIRKDDCSLKTRITAIRPNSYSFGDRYFKKNGKWHFERTTDFRTHPKFGKRIYHAFKPLWWTIHFWDWLIADRFIPSWSYGFSTLTAYPDANPETSTVDGFVLHNDTTGTASFSDVRNGAGTGSNDSGGSNQDVIRIVGDSASGFWGAIVRGIFLFDTSTIGSSATISSAVLSLYGNTKSNPTPGLTLDINIYSSNPASNTSLSSGDYTSLGTTEFATTISYSSFATSSYNDFTLNSNGISAVNKSGISKYGARNPSHDVANTAYTWDAQQNRIRTNYADTAGTTTDPKLVVTYTTTVNYTLTADQTSFTYSGEASLLNVGHQIIAALGTYALTGFSMLLSQGKVLAAAIGSFTYAGYNAVITSVRAITAAVSSFSFNGQNSLFLLSHTIITSVGNFTYMGISTAFNFGKKIIATVSSFALTGQNAVFPITRLLTAFYGSLTISWQTFRLLLNGFLAIFGDKYTRRNSSYSNKYSEQETSYSDKYTHLT